VQLGRLFDHTRHPLEKQHLQTPSPQPQTKEQTHRLQRQTPLTVRARSDDKRFIEIFLRPILSLCSDQLFGFMTSLGSQQSGTPNPAHPTSRFFYYPSSKNRFSTGRFRCCD
jgi:hypothetical protein